MERGVFEINYFSKEPLYIKKIEGLVADKQRELFTNDSLIIGGHK
jgi:hypothetical protein